MCGFVGVLAAESMSDAYIASGLVAAMRDELVHRGPDDAGLWLDPSGQLALGFRRLSIIDLSEAGHQPMLSGDGRIAIVLNGEIYNFAALRAELEAEAGPRRWRGHSDTEVLVEAIAFWGVEQAVRRANGMFAFAAWDRHQRTLWLGRDRLGKKPLYYGWAGKSFVFGSELKALWQHPDFDFRIDAESLANFVQLGYVPGARSIFAGTCKLQNGHLLRLDAPGLRHGENPRSVPYWTLRDAAHLGLDAQQSGRPASVEEFDALMRDAVALRMVADVPVGAFLSGGIDSSLITALMAAESPDEVRSYSIGFRVEGWDEAGHARAVASHLGTRHDECYVGADEAMSIVPDLPSFYDEPFADDSMIPTVLLCRLARRDVTVALSGDGGDELFAGYEKYANADRWLARSRAMPRLARSLAGEFVSRVGEPLADRWGSRRAERRMHLLGGLLDDGRAESFNEVIMTHTAHPRRFVNAPDVPRHPLASGAYNLERSSPIDRMLFMDAGTYLIDDILVKVDRASMANSLEVRCPLLDYRLVELSWRFPTREKTRLGIGKLPLREMLYRHVPRELLERPKRGFGAPVEFWLRGELRGWGDALMSRGGLARHGLLNVEACRRVWENFAHQGGGWHPLIWNLLMFQAWYEWMSKIAAQPRRILPEVPRLAATA